MGEQHGTTNKRRETVPKVEMNDFFRIPKDGMKYRT